MKIDELLSKATDSFAVKKVYAEPYEKDGITVIAAARVTGGGGGGGGVDKDGQQGEGSGFGVTAKPAGAFIISDGKVRWEPAVDVNRVWGTIGVTAVAALLVAARIVRIRTQAGTRRPRAR